MKPYIWTEISLAEVEGYIGKVLRVVIEDTPIQGILLDVYEDGLYLEIGESHYIFLDNDTYATEKTKYEVVQFIEFPESGIHD